MPTTLHYAFLIVAAIVLLLVLPFYALVLAWRWLGTDPQDRPERRAGGGSMSNAIGGSMLELDKLTRPSVEHTIDSQSPIAEADEQDGE